MSGINSYSKAPIPQSPLTDENGIVSHMWHLFFQNLAAGIVPYVRQVVTNGFTFTVPQGVKEVLLDPAAPIATGTLITPVSATDGQDIMFMTSQTITACTFSANTGQTIVNAPTTLVAGTGVAFKFSQQSNTWYKK